MSVYDKELIINGKAVRSPEQQVWENMKDIKALQLKIKEAYKCAGELNTASISVAKSLTNAGEDVKEGWLLDTVGNLFSITGGDEDSLLLDFYCSIRGPQGETGPSGAELEIDDSGTSATKVWSSQKVAQEVANAGKKYYLHTITWKAPNDHPNEWHSIFFTCTSEDPLTYDQLKQWLLDRGYAQPVGDSSDQTNVYPCATGLVYNGSYYTFRGVIVSNDRNYIFKAMNNASSFAYFTNLNNTEYKVNEIE